MKIFKALLFLVILCFLFAFEAYKPNPQQQIIVFEGSDWCINCRRFEDKILKDSLFINFLTEQDISVEKIDFPQRKKLTKDQRKHNKSVADKYEFDGNFPTIVLARTDTFVYDKIYFLNQTVDEMIHQIQEKMKSLK